MDNLVNQMVERLCDDDLNIKVLSFIAHKDGEEMVTVSTIMQNVVALRRMAVRDHKGKVAAYEMRESNINRQAAERVVDRLYYACLIDVEEKLPHRFIKLNELGMKVVIEIVRRKQANE